MMSLRTWCARHDAALISWGVTLIIVVFFAVLGWQLHRADVRAAAAHRARDEREAMEEATKLALTGKCYEDGGVPVMGFGSPPEIVCVGPRGLLWARPQRWEVGP